MDCKKETDGENDTDKKSQEEQGEDNTLHISKTKFDQVQCYRL